jgi:hypothetical protein
VKGITELLSVTPDLQSAITMYPGMMRGAKDLEELTGGKVKAEESMKTLAKALENLGGGIDPKTHELSPERMSQAMNEAVKTIIAGGGFINDATLFGLAKQAGGMGRMTDPGHLFDETITSLIDMGGQRTGTALPSLGREFLGDKMTKQTASELEELGILSHGSWRSGGGSGIIMNPGYEIKGIDDIKSGDLPDFMNTVLGPAIRAKVGDSNRALMEESYKIFGQQTGERLGLMFLQNEAQRQRDVNLRQGVDPDSVYKGIGDKDYAQNVSNLGASFQSLMQVVGSNAIPGAITTIHGITDALQGLTKLAADHPAASNDVLGSLLTPSLVTNAVGAMKDLLDHIRAPGSDAASHMPARPFTPTPGVMQPNPRGDGPLSPIPVSIVSAPGAAAAPHVEAIAPSRPYDPLSSIHAPSIAAPPVTISSPITAPLNGTATVNVTVNNAGLLEEVKQVIQSEIKGAFNGLGRMFKSSSGNSSAGFDGRAAATTPDGSVMHGGH